MEFDGTEIVRLKVHGSLQWVSSVDQPRIYPGYVPMTVQLHLERIGLRGIGSPYMIRDR